MEIVVLEHGPHVSFVLCGVSYFISNVVKDQDSLIVYTPECLRTERNIGARTGHEAKRIDPQNATVKFIDTATREKGVLAYDKLVVAASAQVTMIEANDSGLPGSEPEIAALIREELGGTGLSPASCFSGVRRLRPGSPTRLAEAGG